MGEPHTFARSHLQPHHMLFVFLLQSLPRPWEVSLSSILQFCWMYFEIRCCYSIWSCFPHQKKKATISVSNLHAQKKGNIQSQSIFYTILSSLFLVLLCVATTISQLFKSYNRTFPPVHTIIPFITRLQLSLYTSSLIMLTENNRLFQRSQNFHKEPVPLSDFPEIHYTSFRSYLNLLVEVP